MDNKLRYNISSWRQLPNCLSNNSSKLHIRVADINDKRISAIRISVVHDKYGTLFACVVHANGNLFTHVDGEVFELSTQNIISELYKYGFIVTYTKRKNLPSATLDYLMSLVHLSYDKIRLLYTWNTKNGVKEYTYNVVGFVADSHPKWLDNTYRPPQTELESALLEGTAVNIGKSPIGKQTKWDWLDYVADIEDILLDNSGV